VNHGLHSVETASLKIHARWPWVFLFAVAMAWVEAAVVFYLRSWFGRIDPYQPDPLAVSRDVGSIEIAREAATLVMLLSVGWLAGKTGRSRLGYFVAAFGMWDIFYYVFLKIICDWPHSVFDWDVLFLIPLPWWGPVLAPVSIATLMTAGGFLVGEFDEPEKPVWPGKMTFLLSAIGTLLALYTFMADTLRAAPQGIEAVRNVLPQSFNWPLFLVALTLMAAPVADVSRQVSRQRSKVFPATAVH
jgi:hypothetical protein